MKLKCDIIIQDLNRKEHHEKCYKNCMLGIYRAEESNKSSSNIILTIKSKTTSEIKYKLNKIETYTKYISEGKSTINLVDQKILIMISNTPSQNLINFISFLKIKFNKNKNIQISDDNDENYEKKENIKNSKKPINYINKLLMNAECVNNNLKVISPLTDKEINDLMNNKNKNKSATPIRAHSSVNCINHSNNNNKASNALKELNLNSNNLNRSVKTNSNDTSKSSLVKLTSEQIDILNAVKSGKNVFFTGGAGVGMFILFYRNFIFI